MKFKIDKTINKINARDAIKWAKENVYMFDYLKERKDTWEILFEENLVWIGKGEVIEC